MSLLAEVITTPTARYAGAPAFLAGWPKRDAPIGLAPGERVLIHELPDRRARLGSYLATLGLFELWRRRTHFILTDRRLVAVRGLVSRDQQIIPLDKVQEATVRGRTVWVSTVGGALGTQPFGPMGREQARRLAEALQRGRPSA